jgi:spermidine/putrescine transport system permease protein
MASTIPAELDAALSPSHDPTPPPRRLATTATGSQRGAWWAPWLLLLPGVIWLVVFYGIPLVTLFFRAIGGGWSSFSGAFNEAMARSFGYAAVSTLLAFLLGYPLAYWIATKGGAWKPLLIALVNVPFFTTYLLRTVSWRILLGADGPVVSVLDRLGIVEGGTRLTGNTFAVIGAITYNFLPFMILPIYVSLEKIDRRLVEAGSDLYATPAQTFRRVTFPLSLPGVIAGSLLTFIPAVGDFVNARIVGTPNQFMIGNLIESRFFRTLQYEEAAGYSFVLMAIVLVIVLAYTKAFGTEDLG